MDLSWEVENKQLHETGAGVYVQNQQTGPRSQVNQQAPPSQDLNHGCLQTWWVKGISIEVTEDQRTTQGSGSRPATLSIVPELYTAWGQKGEGARRVHLESQQ